MEYMYTQRKYLVGWKSWAELMLNLYDHPVIVGEKNGDAIVPLSQFESDKIVAKKSYANGSALAQTEPSLLAYYVEHPSVIAHAWLLGQYKNAHTGEVKFVVSNQKSPY